MEVLKGIKTVQQIAKEFEVHLGRFNRVFTEWLWRSIKYEAIFIREHSTVDALEWKVERWMKH